MKYATANRAKPPKTIAPLFTTPGLLKSISFLTVELSKIVRLLFPSVLLCTELIGDMGSWILLAVVVLLVIIFVLDSVVFVSFAIVVTFPETKLFQNKFGLQKNL